LKNEARRLRRAVTKNRQRALAAIFAPVMIVIAALATLATNAAASSSPASGASTTSGVRPAAEPISSIKTIPPTETITAPDSQTPTYTTTAPDSQTPTYTTTAPDSQTPSYTTTAPDSQTPSYTTTAPDSQTPSYTTTAPASVTPTATISMTPTPSSTPKCVPNSKSISYYKDVKGGIEVVVGGHNLVLCQPVYARSVGWTYEKTTSMWPQDHPASGALVKIAKSGVYFIPAGKGCEVDFYASLGKAPVYPTVLTGPGKPYEPKFLNSYFSGKDAVLFYITPAQCQCGKERASL
jgi:hypothetical protein